MKNVYLITSLLIVLSTIFVVNDIYAGNEQRIGSNGASELLLNPWARSSGWADANVACVVGLEGMYQNIAGMAMIKRSEFAFTNAKLFGKNGVSINNGGFATKVGEVGVLGVSVTNLNFGEIEITTTQLPDGGIGHFNPSYSVISVGYAREFSNSIFGGIAIKLINESIFNLSSTGVAIDAGIQYVTGLGRDKAGNKNRDNLKFGITMKNVGTTMKFTGDGMSFTGFSETGTSMTIEHRSQQFDLPSLIKIGFSYKFRLAPKVDEANETVSSNHNLILAANFTANSFSKDQIHAGLEYEFNNILFLRAGYCYENGITKVDKRTSLFTGPTAGMTVNIPINKEKKSVIALDYSYRLTNPLGGVHTFGARITL